jgi:hypothetical protein
MTARIPGFTAASSLTHAVQLSRSGTLIVVETGLVVAQAQNTGGGPQNQDPTWCDFKYALCMLWCSFKDIYWGFRFGVPVPVLSTACRVSCGADRTLCKIT